MYACKSGRHSGSLTAAGALAWADVSVPVGLVLTLPLDRGRSSYHSAPVFEDEPTVPRVDGRLSDPCVGDREPVSSCRPVAPCWKRTGCHWKPPGAFCTP